MSTSEHDLRQRDGDRPPPRHAARRDGVEGNARLTGSTAALLFVLLAAEGVTVLRVRSLLTPHVFIGMLLVPPILLKIGSTMWRFARYYSGDPGYRRNGPPPMGLRLLGPVVIILTVVVFATGIVLMLGPTSWRTQLLFFHKASFIVWLAAMAVHVLGHLAETATLAPRDWVGRTRREVAGAGLRQWALAASLALGLVLAFMVVPSVGPWLRAVTTGHP
ncbi:MAG TPA: hypothetical protein VNG12_17700 [Acidimicrobiales bacterium]|nr:hypothetical protein [Acidimicrobiales bacterium]